MAKKSVITTDIALVYQNILSTLRNAKNNSYRAINANMLKAYWEVGKIIVEEQQKGVGRAKYGEYLGYMRQLYLTFPIHHTLSGELGWSHYRALIGIKNQSAREYYLNESVEQNWIVRKA